MAEGYVMKSFSFENPVAVANVLGVLQTYLGTKEVGPTNGTIRGYGSSYALLKDRRHDNRSRLLHSEYLVHTDARIGDANNAKGKKFVVEGVNGNRISEEQVKEVQEALKGLSIN